MSPSSPRRRVIIAGTDVSHAPLPAAPQPPTRPQAPAGAGTPAPGTPGFTASAPAVPTVSASRLEEMRRDAATRTRQVAHRAEAVGKDLSDLRRRDLDDLDARTTALQERIEDERRLRAAQAARTVRAERERATESLADLLSSLAPGVAGYPWADLTAGSAGSAAGIGREPERAAGWQAGPARYVRVGSARVGDRSGAVPALAPLLCESHWRVTGSTRQAQELVLSVLARIIGQIPLRHLRILVLDPRVTGVAGPLAPLRDAVGSCLPPAMTDAQSMTRALREAMTRAAANAERIAVAGARDLLDLWERDGEASGSLTIAVVLDHPYCADDELRRVLSQVAAMRPASGLHLIVQSDPAYGEADPGPGRWTGLHVSGGRWAVPGMPGTVVVEHDGAAPLDGVGRVIRDAVERTRAVTGPTIPLTDLISQDLEQPWTGSSQDGLDAVIGRAGREPLVLSLRTENPPHPNVLIGGAVGQGKSNLLLDIVYSLAARYSPQELGMLLLDYKRGLEFARFAPDEAGENWLPHVRVLSLESDQEFGVAVLDHVQEELERRSRLFKEAGASSIVAYRSLAGRAMPRLLLMIDEFHVMFEGDEDLVDRAVAVVETIAKQGRAYGIHLLLASQTLSGISGLRAKGDAIFAQFPLRMSLKNTAQESEAILAPHNRAAAELTYRGEVIVNRNFGLDPAGSNVRATAAWAAGEAMADIQRRLWAHGHDDPPLVFVGAEEATWPLARLRAEIAAPGPRTAPTLWLGRPVAVGDVPAALHLDTDVDQGVVLVGTGDELADAVLGSAILTALATADERTGLLVLNGLDSPPPRLTAVLDAWREAGREVRVADRTQVARVLVEEVAPLLERDAPSPLLVVGVGLQRAIGMDRPYRAPAPGPDADPPVGLAVKGAAGLDAEGATTASADSSGWGAGLDTGWGAGGLPPEPVTPASVLQKVFTDGALHQVFAIGWWTTPRAMGRDLGQYQRPGVRAMVFLRMGLNDLRELTGPHVKPLGRGPRVGFVDHAGDAGLRVLVPLAAPGSRVLDAVRAERSTP